MHWVAIAGTNYTSRAVSPTAKLAMPLAGWICGVLVIVFSPGTRLELILMPGSGLLFCSAPVCDILGPPPQNQCPAIQGNLTGFGLPESSRKDNAEFFWIHPMQEGN
jgi:hypothetical protein